MYGYTGSLCEKNRERVGRPCVVDALDDAVRHEVVRHVGGGQADLLQQLHVDAGVADARQLVRSLDVKSIIIASRRSQPQCSITDHKQREGEKEHEEDEEQEEEEDEEEEKDEQVEEEQEREEE